MKKAFNQLKKSYPWPNVTGFTAHDFTLGGGGRELIEREIEVIKAAKGAGEPIYMVEIGCFMCASTKRWLTKFPDLHIVGVDPWPESLKEQVTKYVDRPLLNRLYPNPDHQQKFVDDVRSQGPMETGLANLTGFEDRFIPVKGYSPNALHIIADTGFVPDIVYIDGAKQSEDLDVSHALWPTAKITGDDWHWGRTYGYPMRKIVKKFAKTHDYGIEANWATWIIHKQMDSSLIIQAGHKSDLNKIYMLVKGEQPDLFDNQELMADYYAENLSRTLVVYDGKLLVGVGTIKDGSANIAVILSGEKSDQISAALSKAIKAILML